MVKERVHTTIILNAAAGQVRAYRTIVAAAIKSAKIKRADSLCEYYPVGHEDVDAARYPLYTTLEEFDAIVAHAGAAFQAQGWTTASGHLCQLEAFRDEV